MKLKNKLILAIVICVMVISTLIGKKRVVLIKSQMGTPIYAFSGDSIYWQVSQNLPKCTKLSVDGKALYIHRANFQIIDTALLSEIDEQGMNKETQREGD